MHLESEPPDLPPPPLTEAVAAGALAAQAAESSGHHGPSHTHCENCGTPLAGPYCHKCGQHDFEFHRSFRHVFMEALENFFHFDAKFFRNIATLLFYPGRLTAEFNSGKRASQMPPFRLYVFISLLFFFFIFLGKKVDDPLKEDRPGELKSLGVVKDPRALKEALTEMKKDLAEDHAVQEAAAPSVEKTPSGAATKSGAKKPVQQSEFGQWIQHHGERMVDPAHRKEVSEVFVHSIPKMLLVCLPFFALFTRFLFRKSGQVYLQHLVLALHFHTFIYLWWLFSTGWGFLAGFAPFALQGWVVFACNAWMTLYPFLMLRRLFANSWPKTIFKGILLTFAYIFTLATVFIATVIIIFAMV